MKLNTKQIAYERVNLLIQYAMSHFKSDTKLAVRYLSLARKICTKNRIKIPYEITMCFCKKCKCCIIPCLNSRIRIGSSRIKSIRITCNLCGHTYRKIISK